MNRADFQKFLKDGTVTFAGGVDGSRPPSQLDPDQVAFLINGTARNGVLSPRPGWKKVAITFDTNVQTDWNIGPFQDGFFYDGNGSPALLSSHGGRQFKVDLATKVVTEITPTKAYSVLTTTSNFTVPSAAGTVLVHVADTTNMTTTFPVMSIGGYTLTLTTINSSTTITVRNDIAAQAGNVVVIGATAMFTGYDPNNPSKTLNWSLQAENYWILQDNQSYPIIFDGNQAVRSNPAKNQVPVGNVMCYAQGRMLVALPDRQSYRAGDIVFGASGTAATNGRDAELYFTENNYLNEGGDFVARVFGAPSNSGQIKSMKACSQSDVQLGQGSVLVGSPNTVFTVNLPFDRTTWKDLANALQTANPIKGMMGQNSTVLVNTDQWYRSPDGVRSYIMAQRQFNGSPGNTPMSVEMGDIFDADTKAWLEWGSAVLFDNRLLMTVSPQMTAYGVYHRGLAVIDYNEISTMRHKSAPVWDGIWSGIKILKIVSGTVNDVERCFMYVLNASNQYEIWELSKADRTDNNGVTAPLISWQADTRGYSFNDLDQFKKLKTARLILTGMSGVVSGVVKYISDESSCWNDWYTFTRCAKNSDCGPFACSGPQQYQDQSRFPVRLPDPTDDMDTITKRMKSTGYEFALRVSMTGFCSIQSIRVYSLPEPESLGIDSQTEDETSNPCTVGQVCATCNSIFQVT